MNLRKIFYYIISILIVFFTIFEILNCQIALSASPTPSPSTDINSCNQKAEILGQSITIAQKNIRLLNDDFPPENDKNNHKYWKNRKDITYPAEIKFNLGWPPIKIEYFSTIENYMTDEGRQLYNETLNNIIIASKTSDEMDALGCPDGTQVITNTFADINNRNFTRTFGEVKQNVISKLKKLAQMTSDKQVTTSGIPYSDNACRKKCKENVHEWLQEGYCAALCIINEAFANFIEWAIEMLIKAAAVS